MILCEMTPSIVDAAKQEIEQLPATLSPAEAAAKVAEILAAKLEYIDSVCSERDEIIRMRGSALDMAALLSGSHPPGTPSQATGESAPKPKVRRKRTGRSKLIREAARRKIRELNRPMLSGEIAEVLQSEEQFEGMDVDSSTVSAALQFGERQGVFVSEKEGGKLLWNIPGAIPANEQYEFGQR